MTAVRDLHEKWMQDADYREAYHEEMKGSGLNCQLHLGDCLEVMKGIPARTIDAIIVDPPYGTTHCNWDSVIPFNLMWESIERIIKPNAAIAMFGSQPFTSALIMSNPNRFRCEWIWHKSNGGGFLNANRHPMKRHENICVFSFGGGINKYYPQKTKGKPYACTSAGVGATTADESVIGWRTVNSGDRYPITVQKFSNETGLHPTQKPVDLLAYLIRTYTMPGETVLDFTMGSGSTGVAALQEGRNFIGIEKDEGYFKIAQERLAKTQSPAQLQLV